METIEDSDAQIAEYTGASDTCFYDAECQDEQ